MTDKMTDNRAFKLSDVIVGSSVMRGYAGSVPRLTMGTVHRILPGICFEVSVGDGTALLWRAYELFTETEAAKILEQPDEYTLIVRSRSRSGRPDHADEKENFWAVVDCDFWVAQGVDPLFLATSSDCVEGVMPPSPTELKEELEAVRDLAADRGANSLAAWTRQMERVEALDTTIRSTPIATPPRNRKPFVCPSAPIKGSNGNGNGNGSDSDNDSGSGSGGDSDNDSDSGNDSDYEPSGSGNDNGNDSDNDSDQEYDTYIPRRNLESIPSLMEAISAVQEFLETEHLVIIPNKVFIALFAILMTLLTLTILAVPNR